MKKGFTLSEVLITVLIMMVLVSMAVPAYEKMIEKSRLSEARAMLKRIYESKMRILDNMDKTTYDGSFGFENLDFQFECKNTATDNGHIVACSSDDFTYRISTMAGFKNRVCAVRRKGDNAGTIFVYGPATSSSTDLVFQCFTSGFQQCPFYGMQPLDDNGNICHAID